MLFLGGDAPNARGCGRFAAEPMEAIQMTNVYRGDPAPHDGPEQTDALAALDVLPVDRKLCRLSVVFACCRGSGHCSRMGRSEGVPRAARNYQQQTKRR
jgi:hypothetical protein